MRHKKNKTATGKADKPGKGKERKQNDLQNLRHNIH
jgi:hypothetical protein